MHVGLGLGLILFAAGTCYVPIGDPIESGSIINESAAPVIVNVETIGAKLIAAGARGDIYSVAGRHGYKVSVMAPDCTLLADTSNTGLGLLISVQPDKTVRFEQGANLTPLRSSGSITETDDCT